ncbi:MAG: MarR family transcriptional regulator [Oscillospiraceae bacterium]|nr:MarR family transcriptional regulator [Oscillospiraceae bacterium]
MSNEELMNMLFQVSMLTRRPGRPVGPAPGGGLPDENASDQFMRMRFPPPVKDMTSVGFRSQGRVLALLSVRDGVTQKSLAEAMWIRPPSLSELLFKMEEDGLIERRINEKDRRQVLVYIAEKGRRIAAMFSAERERRTEEFFSALSEDEKTTLALLLRKLLDSNSEKEKEK